MNNEKFFSSFTKKKSDGRPRLDFYPLNSSSLDSLKKCFEVNGDTVLMVDSLILDPVKSLLTTSLVQESGICKTIRIPPSIQEFNIRKKLSEKNKVPLFEVPKTTQNIVMFAPPRLRSMGTIAAVIKYWRQYAKILEKEMKDEAAAKIKAEKKKNKKKKKKIKIGLFGKKKTETETDTELTEGGEITTEEPTEEEEVHIEEEEEDDDEEDEDDDDVAVTEEELQAALEEKKALQQHLRIFLYFLPRKTYICKKVLVEKYEINIPQDVVVRELPIDLLPADYDVLTLQLPYCFKEIYLEGDLTTLSFVARSIMKLQTIFGPIPNVRAKGDHSVRVANMLQRMQRKVGKVNENIPSSIHTLMVVDRSVDFLSPFLTQRTYEGLLDELYGIRNGFVRLGNAKAPPIRVSSQDSIYKDIRDVNIRHLGPILKQRTSALSRALDEKNRINNYSPKQLTEFTRRLPQIIKEKRNIEIHINIVSLINKLCGSRNFTEGLEMEKYIMTSSNLRDVYEYIERLIYLQEPITKVLRYIILLSQTQHGIYVKKYHSFRKEIVETYGLHHMITMNHLEAMNLIVLKNKPENDTTQFVHQEVHDVSFKHLKNRFDLLDIRDPEDEDQLEVYDPHQTYEAYAPLSTQMITKLADSQWDQDVLNQFSGSSLYYKQNAKMSTDTKVCLVYFVGGCTFAEISALRYHNFNRKPDQYHFVVATTNIINGDSLLDNCIEEY